MRTKKNATVLLIIRCFINNKFIELYQGVHMEKLQVSFGTHIRKLRIEQGFSQEKFALHIGMDRTYYASVESGKRNISLLNIYKISNGLGLHLSELFENIEEE